MRSLRRTIRLKDGVEVATLFTPHLYSYAPEKGLTLEADSGDLMQVLSVYADIFYLSALNAWELDGHGTAEDFPYTRGDFHEYASADPKAFARDVDFAVQALTGKSVKDLVQSEEKSEKQPGSEASGDKKKVSRWIGRRLRRSL